MENMLKKYVAYFYKKTSRKDKTKSNSSMSYYLALMKLSALIFFLLLLMAFISDKLLMTGIFSLLSSAMKNQSRAQQYIIIGLTMSPILLILIILFPKDSIQKIILSEQEERKFRIISVCTPIVLCLLSLIAVFLLKK